MSITWLIGNVLLLPTDLFPIGDVMMYSFRLSNLPGRVIVIVLIIGSIMAWSIMVTKMKVLRTSKSESQRFVSAYRKGPHPFSLLLKRQQFSASPLFRVYFDGCNSLRPQIELGLGSSSADMFTGENIAGLPTLSEEDMRHFRNAVQQSVGKQVFVLEEHMGLLATAVTAAPFLGLLGTVWGVLDTFCNMAAQGIIVLSGVAPGVAGALLTTVVGLLVALPSAIGYNILSTQIKRLIADTDDFSSEFILDVECHCEEKIKVK